jgi:hypothetical protein
MRGSGRFIDEALEVEVEVVEELHDPHYLLVKLA